jgi:hypothetical protein
MVKDSFTPIREDVLRISQATAARNHWGVLGIPAGSNYKQIKTAHRKWMRRLHPDRWFASADSKLYGEIQEAFYQVQVAYFEALKQCASTQEPATAPEPIATPSSGSNTSGETGFFAWLLRLLQKFPLLSFARRNPS